MKNFLLDMLGVDESASLQEAISELMHEDWTPGEISDVEVCEIVIRAIGSKSKIQFAETKLSGPVIANVAKAHKLLQWKPLKGRKDLEEAIVRMTQKEVSRLRH